MKVCVSLKELYENGVKYLSFGGKIIHSIAGDQHFYDLYKDDDIDCERFLLCDGESVDIEKKYNVSTGLPYWYGVTEHNTGIYLTDDEYKIAVFQ